MRKLKSAPLGLPTLLSVLVVLLVFTVSSVTYLTARQTRLSLLKSFEVLKESYDLEAIAQTEGQTFLTQTQNAMDAKTTYKEWLRTLSEQDDISLDAAKRSVSLTVSSPSQQIILTYRLDPSFTTLPILIQSTHQSGLTQDYTQNGDPVFGGTK